MSASPLEALLRQRIAVGGPLSFRDFMAEALYHPEHGYYSRLRGFGVEGDFITSPETHPVFGVLLSRQAEEVWDALGRPATFRVREHGAGSGALAAAFLSAWQAEWGMWGDEAPTAVEPSCTVRGVEVEYSIEETSPSLRQVQRERLGDRGVTWEGAGGAHFVIANEVLDAQPVHRVTVRGGHLREMRVGLSDDGRFEWVEADPPEDVVASFRRLRLMPPEGGVAEVNTGLEAWMGLLYQRMERGLALVIDYGYLADEMFARAPGTLVTYYRHTAGSDPLVRIGQQDISVHVDFSTAAWAAQRAGFEVLGLTEQRAMLRNLGLDQYRGVLAGKADQRALGSLLDPGGLGRVRALFLAKGMGGFRPSGLVGGRTWPDPRFVPGLPPEEPPEDFLEMWREAFSGGDDRSNG